MYYCINVLLVCSFKEHTSPKLICSGVLGGYCPGLCQEEWWVSMQSLHSLLLYCMSIYCICVYVCVAAKDWGRQDREVYYWYFMQNCMDIWIESMVVKADVWKIRVRRQCVFEKRIYASKRRILCMMSVVTMWKVMQNFVWVFVCALSHRCSAQLGCGVFESPVEKGVTQLTNSMESNLSHTQTYCTGAHTQATVCVSLSYRLVPPQRIKSVYLYLW